MKQMWMIGAVAVLMLADVAESGVGSWIARSGKRVVRAVMRKSGNVMSKGTQAAIRKACPTQAEDAVKLGGNMAMTWCEWLRSTGTMRRGSC